MDRGIIYYAPIVPFNDSQYAINIPIFYNSLSLNPCLLKPPILERGL